MTIIILRYEKKKITHTCVCVVTHHCSSVVNAAGLRDRVLDLRETSKQCGLGGGDTLIDQDFIRIGLWREIHR